MTLPRRARCSLREPHVGRPMRWPTMMQVFNVGNDRDGRLIVTVPSDQVELAARGNPDPIHPSLDHIVPVTEGGTGQPEEKSPAVNQEYGRAITAGFTTAYNHTAEPTVLAAIYADYILAFNGLLIRDLPFNGGPDNAVSTRFALRLVAPAAVNAPARVRFERC